MKDKKPHLTRLPALVALLAVAACDDGSSTNATGSTTTTTGTESTTSSGSSSGSSASGGAGGMGGAGPSSKITVHTEYIDADGVVQPVAGAQVFTSDADGKLGDGLKQSDANGMITVTVPFEGTLSLAAEVAPNKRIIHTYYDFGAATDVHVLWFGPQPMQPPENTPMPNILVLVSNQPATAKEVVVTASCLYPSVKVPATFPTTSVNLQNYKGCAGEDVYDLAVRSVDAAGQTVASALQHDLAFTPGAPTTDTVTMSTANIAPSSVAVHGADATTQYAAKLWGYADPSGATFAINDVVADAPLGSPGPTFAASAALPLDLYARPTWNVIIYDADGGQGYAVEKGTLGATLNLDVDSGAIARVKSTLDVSDPAHVVLGWTPSGTSTPTFIAGYTTFYDAVDSQKTLKWNVFRRPTGSAGSARFPDLPPELDAWRDTGSSPMVVSGAGTTLFKDLTGYDAFLAKPANLGSNVVTFSSKSIDETLPGN